MRDTEIQKSDDIHLCCIYIYIHILRALVVIQDAISVCSPVPCDFYQLCEAVQRSHEQNANVSVTFSYDSAHMMLNQYDVFYCHRLSLAC